MTRRDVLRATLLAGSALLLNACGQSDGGNGSSGGRTWPPFRYRLTIEVETPLGLRTGSSVIEVRKSEAGKLAIPSPGAVRTELSGEAVAVEVAPGRTLFALLRSDDDPDWAGRALYSVIEQQTTAARVANDDDFAVDMERVLSLQGVHALPRYVERGTGPDSKVSGYPMLVTFGNITDPTSVAKVDPDGLAATFGKGVTLKRITVERTEDAVTTGIEKRLGWLTDPNRKRFPPKKRPEGIPLGNFKGLFSTELSI
jgi:hypothetical protein